MKKAFLILTIIGGTFGMFKGISTLLCDSTLGTMKNSVNNEQTSDYKKYGEFGTKSITVTVTTTVALITGIFGGVAKSIIYITAATVSIITGITGGAAKNKRLIITCAIITFLLGITYLFTYNYLSGSLIAAGGLLGVISGFKKSERST